MRRILTWLFALPLVLAGSQVAHVLAYRWVYPSSTVRLHALLATGHGYMDQLPLVFGIGAAIAGVSLVAAVVDVARGRSLHGLSAWAFALLPVLTFVVQEILERSLHTGTFVWQAVESPTFLPGLVLQLPFAAVAFLVGAAGASHREGGRPAVRRQAASASGRRLACSSASSRCCASAAASAAGGVGGGSSASSVRAVVPARLERQVGAGAFYLPRQGVDTR